MLAEDDGACVPAGPADQPQVGYGHDALPAGGVGRGPAAAGRLKGDHFGGGGGVGRVGAGAFKSGGTKRLDFCTVGKRYNGFLGPSLNARNILLIASYCSRTVLTR